MQKISRKAWLRATVAMASFFFLLAAADTIAGERWSSGDPDGASAPYIGKNTEAGCEVLVYEGLTVWRIARAFDSHPWLIVLVNELDNKATVREGEWILVPGKDCHEITWKYLNPPKDHGRTVQGARASFIFRGMSYELRVMKDAIRLRIASSLLHTHTISTYSVSQLMPLNSFLINS